jgi:DNA invertase Pin-like site-specific DNA recombinase
VRYNAEIKPDRTFNSCWVFLSAIKNSLTSGSGRNYDEIIEQWRIIIKKRRVFIVIIDMPLLDTRRTGRDLTDVFIADLVLQILSYVAQTEREYMRQRQAEGIAAARAKGVRFGRPAFKRPESFDDLQAAWKREEISARAAAKQLGISHKTFLAWAEDGT